MGLIEDNGLEEEMEEDMIAETGNTNYWLGYIPEMDEASDVEEPEAALKKEVAELREEAGDKQSMIQAVQGALECRSVMTDLERARMQLEDVRSSAQRGARDCLSSPAPASATFQSAILASPCLSQLLGGFLEVLPCKLVQLCRQPDATRAAALRICFEKMKRDKNLLRACLVDVWRQEGLIA